MRGRTILVVLALAIGVGAGARAGADDANRKQEGETVARPEEQAIRPEPVLPEGDDYSGREGTPLATVVVTATRTATRLDEATTSVTVIDEPAIEQRQGKTVLEMLQDVPGVDILQNGSRGTNAEIFIRGAEADQTLVLIDGVDLNSVTVGQFDFGTLTTDNIERIEVLRGAGGTLYGSQAVGGVVNIITRQGSGTPRVSFAGEGGNGSTARGAVSSAGQVGGLRYSLAGAYLDTQGFHSQNDDYSNGTASLRLDYDVSAAAVARLFFRYTNTDLGLINNNNFLSRPDPNARQSDEFLVVKGEWEQEVVPNLEVRLAASYARDDQKFKDPPDAAETSRTTSDIPSGIVTGEIQANHYWHRLAITTVGVEIEERTADVRSDTIDPLFELRSRFDKDRRNVAGYFQEQLRLLDGALVAIGGVRVDGNEDFGTAVSPSGSLSYRLPLVPGVRVKAGYAEGFKAPTFNELFFPDFGNPDLDAETSREYNVGLLGSWWGDRAGSEVTGFDRDTKNLIEGTVQPDGSFLAENRGDAHVRGVEVAPRLVLWREPELTFVASYTRLFRVDTAPLLRRPKQRGAFTLNLAGHDLWRPRTRYDLNLNLHVVGDRHDVNPSANFAFATNPAYTKVDLAGSYTLAGVLAGGGDFTLYARVENLLDETYDEALGFRAPPINVLAGVRATF